MIKKKEKQEKKEKKKEEKSAYLPFAPPPSKFDRQTCKAVRIQTMFCKHVYMSDKRGHHIPGTQYVQYIPGIT